MTIKDKLDLIHQRIQNALIRAGRQSENITLIGVTKQVDTTVIQEAVSNGLVELGENRVQELLSKYDQVIGANWHMIGRLQRNKVKYIVDKAAMIHSWTGFRSPVKSTGRQRRYKSNAGFGAGEYCQRGE